MRGGTPGTRPLAARRPVHKACGHLKHGHSRTGRVTPMFGIWVAMKSRCYGNAPNTRRNYQDRGITVCDRWLNSFDAFLSDMGSRPSPRHSIDRIDNDGPYSPDNCRWATPAEQARNRRANHLLTSAGRTMTITEWGRELGLHGTTILYRLACGMTEHEALTTPRRRGRRPTV